MGLTPFWSQSMNCSFSHVRVVSRERERESGGGALGENMIYSVRAALFINMATVTKCGRVLGRTVNCNDRKSKEQNSNIIKCSSTQSLQRFLLFAASIKIKLNFREFSINSELCTNLVLLNIQQKVVKSTMSHKWSLCNAFWNHTSANDMQCLG